MRKFTLPAGRRRGASTLWLILLLPLLLILFFFVVDMAHVWRARVELENALEASALSAVKEWAESGGSPGVGWTDGARMVGVNYAGVNTINGLPVIIGTNGGGFNLATNPNENLTCIIGKTPPTGNLIFGAITNDDPWTFNAGLVPSCGAGNVLFDATAQGGGQTQGALGVDNAWGVAFLETNNVNPALYIEEIVIDLQAGGGNGEFVGTVVLSDNVAPHAVDSPSQFMMMNYDQPDIDGLDDTALVSNTIGTVTTFSNADITFTWDSNTPELLTITFTGDAFRPGDRFRFGAATTGVADTGPGSGNTSNDGDGVGEDMTGVSVLFSTNPVPEEGVFFNNTDQSKDCVPKHPQDPPVYSPFGDLIVHPTLIPNLPCPIASSPGNNGQSYVQLSGEGNRAFGVRAQATVEVPSLFCNFCGLDFGPYCITAKATAMYDCETQRPRLIRVEPEYFICPGP